MANLCASGVLPRFPKLRFATIEAGIGWVPWLLDGDGRGLPQAPLLGAAQAGMLPSEYFREHGFASFQEDPPGLGLAERTDLADNFMWGNDYPHHEGTWPHSARGDRAHDGPPHRRARAKILGLNAARLFGFEVKG